jgi:uncharacterized protein YyaL (SSP411 family)
MATDRNRLDEEQSPYLRQHADNPVHWQPWDEKSLDAAKERDVPIFLSVGYSACHWCHVMEDESFQDESVASTLNENFVPIKVDREERPDLDSIYQTICQLVSGGGGWPLSVWLTPDGKPFYVGTYFPKEARGRTPGFESLLENITDSWTDPDDREEMENRAEQWTSAIEGQLEDVPDQPGEIPESGFLDTVAQSAVRSADREYGGFGSGQKFPQTGRIRALVRAYERTGQSVYREIVEETLDAMAGGGLFDHVGGGFHRYTTDRQWVVPHFEKMLYDNAEISRVLLAGYQLTGHERYADAARRTFDFIKRELTHENGGFYATLDAQSGGEEGTFYVWTPEQVRESVDSETAADLFCDRYGVTESGNFEDNTTVLTIQAHLEELAEEYDISVDVVEEKLGEARQQAFESREERVRPGRDEKVLAGWNGLMISGFAEGALVVDENYAEQARDALSFVHEHLWDEDTGKLSHRYKDGDVKGDGYLEDYAFLARGAIHLYEATGEVEHLNFGIELARVIEREFWDPEEETLYFTPESGETLVARPQELLDQSTPSSAGVAASLFLTLDQFVRHDRFGEIADSALSTHASNIESNPLQHATLALAADEHAFGHVELTIAAAELPSEWRERIGSTYLPRRLVAMRPPSEDGLNEWLASLDLDEAPPIWAKRGTTDDKPTVYLCEEFTCSPPQTDIDAALAWRTENE